MLRMLEDPQVVLRDMTLENPIRAIREISHDTTCRRTVRLANGREVSALDIQREYLDRALRYADAQGFPPLEQRALSGIVSIQAVICSTALRASPSTEASAARSLLGSPKKRERLSIHASSLAKVLAQ